MIQIVLNFANPATGQTTKSEPIIIPVSTEEAVRVLSKALTIDKEYFEAWQANIAMAFKDNAAWFKKSHTGKRNVSNDDIQRIANRAADYFIEQLTGVKIDEMQWNKLKDAQTS